jgi:hypothetical protein
VDFRQCHLNGTESFAIFQSIHLIMDHRLGGNIMTSILGETTKYHGGRGEDQHS